MQVRKILIADDDDDLRGALCEQLTLHPEFATLHAPTAGAALDLARDESPDLTVNAGKDAQYLAAKRFGRHVDGDIGRPRFRDVDDQQQRLGGSCRGAQRDVSGDHKPLLVEP